VSLGTAASGATLRASGWWRGFLLERRRVKEQALKEQIRRDVVKKHLERAKEEAAHPRETREDEAEADVVYIPSVATLRVREKAGEGKFSIQRTVPKGAESPRAPSRAPPRSRRSRTRRSGSSRFRPSRRTAAGSSRPRGFCVPRRSATGRRTARSTARRWS